MKPGFWGLMLFLITFAVFAIAMAGMALKLLLGKSDELQRGWHTRCEEKLKIPARCGSLGCHARIGGGRRRRANISTDWPRPAPPTSKHSHLTGIGWTGTA